MAPRKSALKLKQISVVDLNVHNSKGAADTSVRDWPAGHDCVDIKQPSTSHNPHSDGRALPKVQTHIHTGGTNSDAALDQASQSTSPSTQSLSQASASSQATQALSLTTTSSVSDIHRAAASPTQDKSHKVKHTPQQLKHKPPKPNRSRDSSVGSVDDTTRSSSRARKPTTKAQALADTGSRFYKSLRDTPGVVDDHEELIPPEITEISSQPLQHENLDTPPIATELEDSVMDSVEVTAIRTSPRQRKPSAKVMAEAAEQSTHKRKASPGDAERPTKIPRISSAVPEKPSKLRYSISSADDDTEMGESVVNTQGNTEPKKNADQCRVRCLSPSSRLVAFAKFALDDSDDEDDSQDMAVLLAATVEETNSSFQAFDKFAEQNCRCHTTPIEAAPMTQEESDLVKISQGNVSDSDASVQRARGIINRLNARAELRRASDRLWKGNNKTPETTGATSPITVLHPKINNVVDNLATAKPRTSANPNAVSQPDLTHETKKTQVQASQPRAKAGKVAGDVAYDATERMTERQPQLSSPYVAALWQDIYGNGNGNTGQASSHVQEQSRVISLPHPPSVSSGTTIAATQSVSTKLQSPISMKASSKAKGTNGNSLKKVGMGTSRAPLPSKTDTQETLRPSPRPQSESAPQMNLGDAFEQFFGVPMSVFGERLFAKRKRKPRSSAPRAVTTGNRGGKSGSSRRKTSMRAADESDVEDYGCRQPSGHGTNDIDNSSQALGDKRKSQTLDNVRDLSLTSPGDSTTRPSKKITLKFKQHSNKN